MFDIIDYIYLGSITDLILYRLSPLPVVLFCLFFSITLVRIEKGSFLEDKLCARVPSSVTLKFQ